jgi:hypothetical protein
MRKAIAVLAICGASFAWGADASGIGGPVSGYVVDGRVRALRPINGIPGAARLGDPISLPFAVTNAAVATQQDYAIVTRANSGGSVAMAVGLRSGAPQVLALEGAIIPSGMLIGDAGTAAVLYSNTQLQFVTGLPGAPNVSDAVGLDAVNGVAAAAIDAAGATALLVSSDGNIYRAARGAAPVWIARVPGAASANFLPGTDDAVVASADSGDVVLLHGLSGSLTIRTVAGAANGLTSARSVRAINAGELAVVDGEGRLGVVTIETGSIEWIGLAGAADRIDPLARGLLVLNQAGVRPLLLLDLNQGHAPYFVPADEHGVGGPHRK